VIIILASRHDELARSLAARWDAHEAVVLTARDLSEPGWRYHAPAFERGQAIAGGRPISNREITGVLTRVPGVYEGELDHVMVDDCAYVASEMNAFLLAWLSGLDCRMLNRPTPECLCGPSWRMERWVRVAARLGIPVEPVRRDSAENSLLDFKDSGAVVTVVGQRCFGDVHSSLVDHARRLAAAAEVDLLDVHFTGAERGHRFVNVNLCPDLSAPEISGAVLDYFRGAGEC
jgi:hypothetical protein